MLNWSPVVLSPWLFLVQKIWDKFRIYLKFLNSLHEFRQNVKDCVPQDCPVDYKKIIFITLVLFSKGTGKHIYNLHKL